MQPTPLFNQSSLSDADMRAIEQKLQDIAQIISGKIPALNPEQRQQLGSVKEKNKLIINKVIDCLQNYPGILPPQVDWAVFTQDCELRNDMEKRADRMNEQLQSLTAAKILHDHKCLSNALIYYDYIKYLANAGNNEAAQIMEEMSPLFAKPRQKKP